MKALKNNNIKVEDSFKKYEQYRVKNLPFYDYNNKRYYVDGKKVVLDYSNEEYKIALWLVKKFKLDVYMVPRINIPEGIKTPDFLFMGEFWDLKQISGNGKHTLDSAIKDKENQSKNFILDISKSKIKKEEAIRQLQLIFISKNRYWVKTVILKKNNDVIVILKNKKEIDHQSPIMDQDQFQM